MFAEVDKDECIGCGACPEVCPEVFKMDDDDKASAYKNPVPPEFLETAKEAAEGCPTEAIHFQE